MTEVNVPSNYELRNHVSVAELTRLSEQSTRALAVKMFQQGFEEGRKSALNEHMNNSKVSCY